MAFEAWFDGRCKADQPDRVVDCLWPRAEHLQVVSCCPEHSTMHRACSYPPLSMEGTNGQSDQSWNLANSVATFRITNTSPWRHVNYKVIRYPLQQYLILTGPFAAVIDVGSGNGPHLQAHRGRRRELPGHRDEDERSKLSCSEGEIRSGPQDTDQETPATQGPAQNMAGRH